MVVRPARRFFALSEFSNRECRSEPAIREPTWLLLISTSTATIDRGAWFGRRS
jgi:hypothetical protein